jgi:hypothetical protein
MTSVTRVGQALGNSIRATFAKVTAICSAICEFETKGCSNGEIIDQFGFSQTQVEGLHDRRHMRRECFTNVQKISSLFA